MACAAALVACEMPDWNSDLEAFVDYGRSIAYLDSSSYVQRNAAVNTDVRRGIPVTVTVTLNNPKAIDLEYTISVDSTLVDGTVEPPANTAGADNGITTVSFTFTPAETAEYSDITFKLGIAAPSLNRTFQPATFKVHCDSPPDPVTNLTAGISTDGKACIGFTLPEDYADADIAKVEITYASSTANTAKTVTEDVSQTGTGLTTVPAPSPLSSNVGKYVRYYLPDDVIAGNQYTFTVTPIDASGKKGETPVSVSITGNELYLGYDANGGTGTVGAAYGYNQATSVKIAGAASLSRDGYGFVEWNTKADGTGKAYTPGANYTFGASSLMLYAQWMKLATVTVAITTPGYQGVTVTQNGVTVTSITMDYEGTLALTMPVSAIDYSWYLDGGTANLNPDASTLSFKPVDNGITGGTHTINAMATDTGSGVAYSANIVVTVTNDYMITIIPYGGTATYTQKTWKYVDASSTSSSFAHTLTRPFSMAKYEVSYDLWSTVYSWATYHGYNFDQAGTDGWPAGSDGTMPVLAISYYDTIVWCNAYSEMKGYTPCYYNSTTDRSPPAVIRKTADLNAIEATSPYYTSDYVLWTANGYRLPTEGEWHFAASCRGYYPYDHVSGNFGYACSTGDSTTYSTWANVFTNHSVSVSALLPNIWGIHNMSGNVWEYCLDLYNDAPISPKSDYVCKEPTNPSTPASLRAVVCGGSFSNGHPKMCATVGNRTSTNLTPGAVDNGFRLARTITK